MPVTIRLDDISVATPCRANWDKMQVRDASGAVRHCQSCQKNVYNLSMLSSDEALALIQQHEGNLCVRFARRADGTLISGDCPVGQRTKRRRRGWTIAALLAAFIPSPVSSLLKRASAATLRAIPAVSTLENTPAGEKVFAWLEPDDAAMLSNQMIMGQIAPTLPTNPSGVKP